MKTSTLKLGFISLIATLFIGCGGAGSASQKTKVLQSAHFVESGAGEIDYKSAPINDTIDTDGIFTYYSGDTTSFYLGNFKFGSITNVNADGLVFIQDIMNVDRESGLQDQGVANLARILLAINDNDISDVNTTQTLNNFDIVNAPEANVTALIASLAELDDINQTVALNHVEYYYKLIKKAPIATTALSHITKSLKMEIDIASISGLLGDDDKLNNLDVYMDGIYQGIITKDVNSSKYTIEITLAGNLDRARSFDIIFKTDQTRNDTHHYESPKYTFTVSSPMQGRWLDSQTRKIVYLKEPSELAGLTFTTVDGVMDIDQLTDSNNPGRYLLRAGIGDVNLYGTIKKLSTNPNPTFDKIEMRIENVAAAITEDFVLALADASNPSGTISTDENATNTLYVDGNSSEYRFPENIDPSIIDIKAITGEVKIYIKESDANSSRTSLFVIDDVIRKTFDVGTLNITDETINYNVISRFKDGADYLYYGYDALDVDDKVITYSKILEVCNNGNANISAATTTVTNNMPALFQTFVVNNSNAVIGGILKGECKDVPLSFSFHKPVAVTDFNLSVNVNSNGVDWSNHQKLTLSNETFIKLNFTSVDGELNGFVIDTDTGWYDKTIISQDGSSHIVLPRLAAKDYKIAVAPQHANAEEAFLVGTEVIPNATDLYLYIGADDNESFNNIYVEDKKGYDTLALRYGKVKAFISYEDIDYLTLDSLPAPTRQYTTYKVDSAISKKTDIVIPFYLKLDAATLGNIKIFDDVDVEVATLTTSFSDANRTVSISNSAAFDTAKTYTVKLLAGLKGAEDTNAALLKDQEFEVNFMKTKLVSASQDGDFGISMVQVRDNDSDIVADINTRLIWQDDNDSRSVIKDYPAANAYCNDLVTPYSSEWRLPTRNELLTLVDYTASSPAMHSAFKYSVKDGKYWTSTIKYGDTASAWLVDFAKGTSSSVNNIASNENVRCVIDSTDTNGSNFYLNSLYVKSNTSGTDFVTDTNGTYLLWQDDADASSLIHSFEDASSYCKNLVLSDNGGTNGTQYSEWRLPTIKELTTIVDDTIGTSNTPAIDNHFENTKATAGSKYWSATQDASISDGAWTISFEYGTHERDLKSNMNYTRCVSRGSL